MAMDLAARAGNELSSASGVKMTRVTQRLNHTEPETMKAGFSLHAAL
jgi:hypothetical protein